MSTATSTSNPSPNSKVASPETKSQTAVASAATDATKSQPADNSGAVLAAVHPKAEGLQSLLKELASPDSARRAAAATALGRLADVAALPALIVALRDADADVAREAALSLGSFSSAAVVEPLIEVLDNRDGYFHSVVRAAATHSLGQLRDLRAVVPLLNAINDPIAETSAEAIRALALLPDPRIVPALLEVVRNEHGFFLGTARRAAILGLAQIGGEQAACELRFVSTNQWEHAAIRATAIDAIREVSTSTAGA
ncbi:MAG TPA: HEAT repeat domain-containing protein [Tepidisphaeraceae bacterium]|jgi:HEAT repeat protein|nr:HEAT repeat domain-containing protein [Tepidisphaeraceae bacterium]